MSAGTYVYVISGDHGRQKIGVSDTPLKRIRELQTGSPFKLKFEFIGATDGTGYDIEGEAHFLLNKHRAEGEWFVVPPEVAITAVMAAARGLGHPIKPVDPEAAVPIVGQIGKPAWQRWVAAPWALGALYVQVVYMWPRLESDEPGATGAVIIESIVMILFLKLAIWLTVKVGNDWISAWHRFDRFAHPPSGIKAPSSPDRPV